LKNYKIHIVCKKSEICSLIKKALSRDNYIVSCTHGRDIEKSLIQEIPLNVDCLIMDKDVEIVCKEEFEKKIKDVSIVYLPSLQSDSNINMGIKYISEPLKLSELTKAVESIFKFKQF